MRRCTKLANVSPFSRPGVDLGDVEAQIRAASERLPGPGVSDVVAFKTGEVLGAVVAPRAVDAKALRTAVAERAPAALVPRSLLAVDALPLTARGKTDRAAAAAAYEASLRTAPPDHQVASSAGASQTARAIADTVRRATGGAAKG